MNNILNTSISLCIISILLSSCGKFGDLNNDPNHATAVPTASLLSSSLRSISDVIGSETGVLYAQMMAQTHFTEASRYAECHFDFNSFYVGPLSNLEEIIRLNTDESTKESMQISGANHNQIAVARILKAYYYHTMTDRWGPIPYSGALQGKDNFFPKYDDQESIYTDLFTELSEAVAQIDDTGYPLQGDFLLNGDMARWKQFANTLHLVMALRLSKVDAEKGKQEFNFALEASGGVLQAVEDNILYPYLEDTDNGNPWYERFESRTDYAVSEPLVRHMKSTNDPRLDHYADPIARSDDEIVGMPYGIESASEILNEDISLPNATYIRAQKEALPVFTYAQVLFSMAEAAHRGWISGSAELMYNDAIAASMAQWEVEGGAFASRSGVIWNNSEALRLIGEQKWVALYPQGLEAWAEWRRLDYPTLAPAPDALNISGEIPRRQGYPVSEQTENSENYQVALDLLNGADVLETRLWWDQ